MKHQIDTRPQETVLVIDDSPEMIDILGEILRPLYQVRFSTNGTDALALVQRLPLVPDKRGLRVAVGADFAVDVPYVLVVAFSFNVFKDFF